MVSEPKNLWRREPRHWPAPYAVDKVRNARKQIHALRAGASVVPQQGGSDRPIASVEKHNPEHLAGQPDGRDISHRVRRTSRKIIKDCDSRPPPCIRFLLRPEWARAVDL